MGKYFLVKNALKEVVFACLAESENDKKITSVLSDGYTVEETTYPRFCFALQIMRHQTAKKFDALIEELSCVSKNEPI